MSLVGTSSANSLHVKDPFVLIMGHREDLSQYDGGRSTLHMSAGSGLDNLSGNLCHGRSGVVA